MTGKAQLEEVEEAMAALARDVDSVRRAERTALMKSDMPMHGLTMPMQRRRLACGYSFSDRPTEDQFAIWDYVWRHARSHEARMQAGFFAEGSKDDIALRWQVTRGWADDIACWDQSDTLSKIYSEALEAMPETVGPVLECWRSDDNRWKRRQSLVALMFHARSRRQCPPVETVLAAVDGLIEDPDHYVQKGLGWTLREASIVYPDAAYAFVCDRAARVHPAAWSTAIEKLPPGRKARAKRLRGRVRGRSTAP